MGVWSVIGAVVKTPRQMGHERMNKLNEVSGDYVIPDMLPYSYNCSKGEVLLRLKPAPLGGRGETVPGRSCVGQAQSNMGL